jgi:hypothetical protein
MAAKTLKEILDKFGWERLQRGELPAEIISEQDDFLGHVSNYSLYALDGVCVITENNRSIVEMSYVEKENGTFRRKAAIPRGTIVKPENIPEFLKGFSRLHSYRSQFAYVKEEKMDFHNIGLRMEKAGELCKNN